MSALSTALAVRSLGLAGMSLFTPENSAAPTPFSSFLDGGFHPLRDPGHLLAMMAIGFVGAQFGGRSRWGLPMLFAAGMTLGVALGAQGVVAPEFDSVASPRGWRSRCLFLPRSD
jgi:hydrogenase/urease accessory protein HupE